MHRRPHFLTALCLLAAAAWALPARADDDFVVYSPYVTPGQSEVEFRGHQTTDSDPALEGERAYAVSLSHSFTDWWRPEVYVGSYEREPGTPTSFEGYEFENTFQLTDQGEYWVDPGFLASFEYSVIPDEPGVLEFGPLFEKHSGRIDQRLNLIWEKQIGGGADRKYEFRASYAWTYQIRPSFAPGFEAYYRPADESRQIGPALYGEIASERGDEFEYSAALVFGTDKGAPNKTWVLRLEYEFN